MRWADEVEVEEEPSPPHPSSQESCSVVGQPVINSTPLGSSSSKDDEQEISFCRTCRASFYVTKRRHSYCKSCYEVWIAKRYGPKLSKREPNSTASRATNSPASTRTDNSSEGGGGTFGKESDEGLFKDLERVVQHGVSFEAEAKPPPPPPPVPLVPEPTNISQLLEQLSTQATPPPRPPPPPAPPPPPPPPVPPPPPKPEMVDSSCQTGLEATTSEFWSELISFQVPPPPPAADAPSKPPSA